jgi:hypothetical protein
MINWNMYAQTGDNIREGLGGLADIAGVSTKAKNRASLDQKFSSLASLGSPETGGMTGLPLEPQRDRLPMGPEREQFAGNPKPQEFDGPLGTFSNKDLIDIMRNPEAQDTERALVMDEYKRRTTPKDPYAERMKQLELQRAEYENAQLGKPVAPAATSDMREYDFAKSQGYQGSFMDFQTARQPKGTTVNVGGNEGALQKELATQEGKNWAAYQKAGAVSAGTVQDMEVLKELAPQVPSGPVAGRLATWFPGVSSSGAAFQSIVSRVAPTLRVEGSGATSDIEYNGMLASLPSLINQPEANIAIAEMMQAKAQINAERGNIVTQYQNGQITDAQARQAMQDLDSRSIITPKMRGLLGLPAAPGAAPAPGGFRILSVE